MAVNIYIMSLNLCNESFNKLLKTPFDEVIYHSNNTFQYYFLFG